MKKNQCWSSQNQFQMNLCNNKTVTPAGRLSSPYQFQIYCSDSPKILPHPVSVPSKIHYFWRVRHVLLVFLRSPKQHRIPVLLFVVNVIASSSKFNEVPRVNTYPGTISYTRDWSDKHPSLENI